MSCSSTIRSNEASFNLAQKLISSLSEKFNFSQEEAWSHVSNNTIVQLQKKFKKEKKANNPLSSIKKPRTSFSFFTKHQRVEIAKKNPKATFGELSKLVSVEWKKLTDKQMKTYKTMELNDKGRYETEKSSLLKKLEQESTSVPEESIPTTEVISKSESSTKSTTKTPTKSTKSASSTPSTPSTGKYHVFQKKQRSIIKTENPSIGVKEINSKLSEMWKSFSTEEKSVYV
jgi:hypothetical protein